GYRSRDPSAAALSRICRVLSLLLIRSRCAHRRADRCCVGSLGSPVDTCSLAVPDWWHRDGLILGLLRTWLGWLVVLGSGRECVVPSVAFGHSFAPFRDCDGEAVRA